MGYETTANGSNDVDVGQGVMIPPGELATNVRNGMVASKSEQNQREAGGILCFRPYCDAWRTVMLFTEVKLLIVDDEPAIRATLSSMFTTVGHSVRCAQDGFSALAALRAEIPDILLSDLNMPGMSGFEFLSVVRRRFPWIPVIAMSGAFSGEGVPLGVAADVFYQKGSGAGALLETVRGVARMQHSSVRHPLASAPIWISHTAQNPTGDNSVTRTVSEASTVSRFGPSRRLRLTAGSASEASASDP